MRKLGRQVAVVERQQPFPMPFGGVAMRHLEEPIGLAAIQSGVDRTAGRRAIEREPMTPEQEQVEIDLARAPARARATAELAFDALEGDQQIRRGDVWGSRGRDVQGDDCIAELGLVGDADEPSRTTSDTTTATATRTTRVEISSFVRADPQTLRIS